MFPNEHDEHYLRGGPMKDLVLVSAFRWTAATPPPSSRIWSRHIPPCR